ncbi:MAG: ATP-dependent helicase, partial [Eubacteriales bacterium]
AGYLKRSQNMPRVYADGILAQNAEEAIDRINRSGKFDEKEKIQATRIIKKLISARSRKLTSDEGAESRVDYIADHLGMPKEDVIHIINILREIKILSDAKDLNGFLTKKTKKNNALSVLNSFWHMEKFLLTVIDEEEKVVHIKELNEQAEEFGCKNVSPNIIKTILNLWNIKKWIKRKTSIYSKNHIAVRGLYSQEKLAEKLENRNTIAQFILEYFYSLSESDKPDNKSQKDEILVEFSVLELKEKFENRSNLFQSKVTSEEIEDALFHLSRIEALKIEGGFMVVYNALTIERLELNNRINYKLEDYQYLDKFYQSKTEQIHIVGEYARKMISNYKAALQFVDDYFKLNYTSFLRRYFPNSREEINRNMTPTKFKQLFGELSPNQLEIINDKNSQYIVVAAGPGSGKTRILVHKLASLMLMEDVKHEQLLMVTFSRAAASEFKKRLLKLLGNAASYVEIKTFHSFCFDLLGRVGTLEKSEVIIRETIRKIKDGEVEPARITKTVLVIDEAQDMDKNEFDLIQALMEYNEDMRVIAVGDDDQNIYEFRGASSKYLEQLIALEKAAMYELVENYRSKSNLVDFSNQFLTRIPNRLKHTPIISVQRDNGIIKLVRYRGNNLITPLVKDILSQGLSGSTCVLVKTNEEALQITGLLIKNGMQARLIQTNDGFKLNNLLEIRYFLNQFNLDNDSPTFSDDVWEQAKRELKERFRSSLNLEICLNLLKDFEAANPNRKYRSDLDIFVRESKLEDFFGEDVETIFVSTIHKAKGREYDNVFLMLDNFNPGRNEAKRQLYVAMTRAKSNLAIHYNGNYFDFIKSEGLRVIDDNENHLEPLELAIQVTYRDVYLDFFQKCQGLIEELNSGDALTFNRDGCCNVNGQVVLRFSKQFKNRLWELEQKNYRPKTGKIRFIVYWKKEGSENEIKIILPELYFERD